MNWYLIRSLPGLPLHVVSGPMSRHKAETLADSLGLSYSARVGGICEGCLAPTVGGRPVGDGCCECRLAEALCAA